MNRTREAELRRLIADPSRRLRWTPEIDDLLWWALREERISPEVYWSIREELKAKGKGETP